MMTAYHGDMVEVVDEEDGAQLLGLEGARQLHQQVHARIPHAVQIVVQLPILHQKHPFDAHCFVFWCATEQFQMILQTLHSMLFPLSKF